MTVHVNQCLSLSSGIAYDAKGSRQVTVGVTVVSQSWHRPRVIGIIDGKCYDMGRGFSDSPTFACLAGDGSRAPRSEAVRAKLLELRPSAESALRRILSDNKPQWSPQETPPQESPQEAPKPVPAPVPSTPAPITPPKPKATGDSLTDAIVGIVSEYASTAIVESLMPRVEGLVADAIAERVPRSLVVKIGDRETRTDEVTHEVMDKVIDCIENGENVLLVGDSGTGKTHLAKQVAALTERDFMLMSKITDVFDLKGFTTANGDFVESPFYTAWVHGGLVCWDEWDASDENAVLWANAAMANGVVTFPNDTKPVAKHPKFAVIATANTEATGADNLYNARNVQDAAARDRFTRLVVDYSAAIEESLTSDRELLAFARALRAAVAAAGVDHVVSYRCIASLDSKVKRGWELGGENGAVKASATKHLTADDCRIIRNKMDGMDKNRYAAAMVA